MQKQSSGCRATVPVAGQSAVPGNGDGRPTTGIQARFSGTRLAVALAACLALPMVVAAQVPAQSYPWEDGAWRNAIDLQPDEALNSLPGRSSSGSAAERRQLDYTRAVLLLNSQPVRQGNIEEARSLLESVRRTGSGDDDLGLAALYYLARIAQFHTIPPRPAEAAALYVELAARAPGHPLAEEAISRWALLRLYEDGLTPAELRARLTEFETAAGRLQNPAAQRDLHLVLANAALTLTGDREAALRHLLAAEEAGIVRPELAGETMVRIALLARDLGHADVAIAHYKSFLAGFQRDDRAYLLAEQLKALDAAPPAP